jgi:hypothetical protein
MTPDENHAAVLLALGGVAAEADLEHLKPEVGFRQQLGVELRDFLTFVMALQFQSLL